MHRARTSALMLLAEIATQADLPLETRIAIGVSRDALLALDEIEPSGPAEHGQESPSVVDVVQLLEAARMGSSREAGRARLAVQWLHGGSSA